MNKIEEIIKNTTEENQEKVDWTKAWSTKYPVLKTYQKEVDVPVYANEIRRLLTLLQNEYGYNELDAMLVLKDILAHEYLDKKKSKQSILTASSGLTLEAVILIIFYLQVIVLYLLQGP